MSEAIISRRGKSSSGLGGNMVTEIVSSNKLWIVPNHIGNVSVLLFGGGGGGYYSNDPIGFSWYVMSGGGGGWMNNESFNIPTGSVINITIGEGGINGSSGGTTSFGPYISASGGSGGGMSSGGSGSSGGGIQSYNYTSDYITGGHGVLFGGGGAYLRIPVLYPDSSRFNVIGGSGGIWGGGGGGYADIERGGSYSRGGAGGTYGGGGGVFVRTLTVENRNAQFGRGGTYGGNGGCEVNRIIQNSAQPGTNTMNIESVPENCRGWGHNGRLGGGGYGGNGGTYGGGGYGGNGGIGGGGYGKGADSDSGGGGYFSKGWFGGGYGDGANNSVSAGFGGGGFGNNVPGGKGICIIQYYI